MTCSEVESGALAEQYVLGRLEEDARQVYEEHYFACESCFRQLQMLQSTQSELMRIPREVQQTRPAWRTWGAIAATALMAVALGWWFTRSSPAPPLDATPVAREKVDTQRQLLARVDPPVWKDTALRGVTGASDQAFGDAMRLYAAGNYADALRGLEKINGKDAAPAFYAAICALELGRAAEGAARLADVEKMGDTPWLEQARFYRAKALLRVGDAAGAADELNAVVALSGDLEAEARRLAAALEASR